MSAGNQQVSALPTTSRLRAKDPAAGVPYAAPNFGRPLVPEIITYSGRNSSFANVYRNPDQAIRESAENARFMRNDPAIMECLESRQRAVALLNWHVEPEDKENPKHKRLAADMTDVLNRIPRFTEYRRNLMEALWYGRHACQNAYALAPIKGHQRVIVYRWLPIHGDKLVFRWDDGSGKYVDGQVGIRTTTLGPLTDPIAGGREAEMCDQGPAYFFKPWERSMLTVHKHIIEDGAYEDAISAGRIHGVGIRDRIYWCWFQKQETMAQLMEVIERTGTGFTIYYYEAGNPASKAAVREVAENQTKSNIILMPRTPGDESHGPPMQRIEPNTAAIQCLQQIVHTFFEHQIKRYIMGQILSSESAATGLGSGVADLHQDTFYQIVNSDAVNLEETITTELLAPLTHFNFPVTSAGVRLYFKIDTKAAESQKRLAAFKTAWDIGAKIRSQDILDTIGATLPQPGDDVLFNLNLAPKPNPAGASNTQPQPREEQPTRYQAGESGPWTEEEEAKHPRAAKGSRHGGEFVRKDEARGSVDPLDERYQQGLRGEVPPHNSLTPEERAAFDAGSKEAFRLGEEIRRRQRKIESARKSRKQNDLSAGQKDRLQKETDGWAAEIDALNAQRQRKDKYVNKTPYKYHTTTEKFGIVAKRIWDDKEKFIDAIVDAIKDKVEGITDPEQLREIAKGIAKKMLTKLAPGVGAAEAAAQAGAAVIELGGELYSFKLNLDAAQTEGDLDEAADKLRQGMAKVLVDKAWDTLVGKIKARAKAAGGKIARGKDGQPDAGAAKQGGGKGGPPPAGGGNPPGGKPDDIQVGVGKGGGANGKKPPGNAGPKAPQAAGVPPVKPPIVVPVGKQKKKGDEENHSNNPKDCANANLANNTNADFAGTLRGGKVTLPGVKTKPITYTKVDPSVAHALRGKFNTTDRPAFLKKIAAKHEAELRKAGLSKKDIADMKNGLAPEDYQVHHKLPLDAGGTNDPSNLILIKNEPYHKTITNYQNDSIRGMAPGEVRKFDFPVPEGFVYPP